MNKTLVVIIMGSISDLAHCEKIAEAARGFNMDVEQRIGSAHKTPAHVSEMLAQYETDPRSRVYITVAGRSNALSGFVDGAVLSPVIACPPPSDAFSGADVFSSLRMPSGIAPALVLEPINAALLAAKILAWADPDVHQSVMDYKREQAKKILKDDKEICPEDSDRIYGG